MKKLGLQPQYPHRWSGHCLICIRYVTRTINNNFQLNEDWNNGTFHWRIQRIIRVKVISTRPPKLNCLNRLDRVMLRWLSRKEIVTLSPQLSPNLARYLVRKAFILDQHKKLLRRKATIRHQLIMNNRETRIFLIPIFDPRVTVLRVSRLSYKDSLSFTLARRLDAFVVLSNSWVIYSVIIRRDVLLAADQRKYSIIKGSLVTIPYKSARSESCAMILVSVR